MILWNFLLNASNGAVTKTDKPQEKKTLICGKKTFKDGEATLKIGGILTTEASLATQKKPENADDRQKPALATGIPEAKVNFDGNYKANNSDWNTGFVMRLDISNDTSKPGEKKIFSYVDKLYAKFENKNYGTFHFGQVKDVINECDAKLAQGNMPTVWIDGGLEHHFAEDLGTAVDNTGSRWYKANDLVGQTGYSMKVNYISPEYKGFKVGLSYAPTESSFAKQGRRNDIGTNYVTALLMWGKKSGDWNLKAAAAGIYSSDSQMNVTYKDKADKDREFKVKSDVTVGKEKLPAGTKITGTFQDDVEQKRKQDYSGTAAYMLSGLIGYKCVSFAVEWMDGRDSKLPMLDKKLGYLEGAKKDFTESKATAGKSLSMSLAWQVNSKHRLGLGYQTSWKKTAQKEDGDKPDTLKIGTVGYAYQMRESLTWYTEGNAVWSHEGLKEEKDRKTNYVIATGFRLEL
ncbi:MAG: porin [Alphaproteobacteria bacterium]|nr:MAG: porin [Alphaproteobacteria bacterium]